MNKLINNAITYKAELPSVDALRTHLQNARFREMLALDWKSAGFVEIPATGELVSTFEGGLAFALRYDTKILPAGVIKAETEKRIKAIMLADGRKLKKQEKLAVKEQVVDDLLPRALHKTAIITCYYATDSQRLIVPVSSKSLADVVTRSLVHAVGSIKTTTINVSDVKLGLTTKLEQWLRDDSDDTMPFGEELEPGGWVKMIGEDERVTFDMTDLGKAQAGINAALASDFRVSELEMTFQGSTSFRLTSDFHIKGIKYSYEPDGEAGDKRDMWDLDASTQLLELNRIIDAMCELLSYKEPAELEVAA